MRICLPFLKPKKSKTQSLPTIRLFRDREFIQPRITEILSGTNPSTTKLIFSKCTIDIGTLQRLLNTGIKEIKLLNCDITAHAWRYGLSQAMYYTENPECDIFIQNMFLDHSCIFINNCTIESKALEALFSPNVKKLFNNAEPYYSPYGAGKYSYTIIFEKKTTQNFTLTDCLLEETIEGNDGLRRFRI